MLIFGLFGLQLPLLNSSQTLLVGLAHLAGGFAIRLAAAFSVPAVSGAVMTTCLSQGDSPGLQGRTLLLRSSCDELSLDAVAKALLSPLAVAVQLSDALTPSPAGQS